MQNFKGDSTELKMQAAANPAFDITGIALDEFFADGYSAVPFVEMLRDEGRIPFSLKIKKAIFAPFYLEALENFPFCGSYESYILILQAIFGDSAEIFFLPLGPGKLRIYLNFDQAEFEIIGRIFESGAYTSYNIASSDSDDILGTGLADALTVEELALLFSEITPEGIYIDLQLNTFEISYFEALQSDAETYDIIDHEGNRLYFMEAI